MKDIWPTTSDRTPDVNPADKPVQDPPVEEGLTSEEKRLRYYRYLVRSGHLTGDTAPDTWAA